MTYCSLKTLVEYVILTVSEMHRDSDQTALSFSGVPRRAEFPFKTWALLSNCLCWVIFHPRASLPKDSIEFSQLTYVCLWSDGRPISLTVSGMVAAAALAEVRRSWLTLVATDINIHPEKCLL